MAILPGYAELQEETSLAQANLLVVENYLLIGVYAFIILLALTNIWKILIRQKKYKTLPLSFFYLFTFIAVTLRIICVIWMFQQPGWYNLLIYVYIGAKLCVGLVQAWMILEITLRIRRDVTVIQGKNVSPNFESFILFG